MRVYVADCGVQGCVAFDAGDGVAFETGLVEEDVDYFDFGEGLVKFLWGYMKYVYVFVLWWNFGLEVRE